MAAGPLLPTDAAVFVLNHFPNGLDFSDTKVHTYGRMSFSTQSTYLTNGMPFLIVGPWTPSAGVPVGFDSAPVYASNPFIHGDAYSTTSGITYVMDPDNQTIRIFPTYGAEMASGSSLPSDTVFVHLVSNRTPDIPLGSGLPVLPT